MRFGSSSSRCSAAFVSLATMLVTGSAATEPTPADMLKVPGGTFTMGADGVGEADEQPAHAVTVPGFFGWTAPR